MSWLLILTGLLVALIAGGVVWDKQSWVPKLALDLEGGTEIILAPQVQEGVTITEEQLSQAVSIIRQRVDAAGVSESEVSTQGGTNIVVSIPGTPDQETLDRIRSSAKMEFRAVLITEMLASLESVGAVDAEGNPTGLPTAIPDPTASPTDGSDINWVNAALYDQYISATCEELDAAGANVADPTKPLVACSDDGAFKYVLGPVEVDGSSIVDAQANYIVGQNGVQTNEWGVYLTFDAEGTTNFATVTTRLSALTGAQNQFAVVLDGRVIIAPATLAVITDGKPVISGAYTEITSKSLADQLKFGALPIGFEVQSSDTVTPTLGVAQLQSGLIAGAIGLVLVIIYSLIQYRALAAVTIASLIVAFGFTYLVITYLSAANGYRLSLAGVAGLIVAIGVTADSFIVYFERVRDELREGRTLGSAVDAGWTRAVRTIVVSDAVNLLAAVVLFVLAVGNVRGFAFTLGVTTVVDLIVVILFTHPMLQLLSRTRFFASGHPMSGLNPRALGAVYRGRAQFNVSETVTVSERGKSSKEARKRQTIAERRAAEQGDAS
jgi:preprotein translocase subunit SecD